MRLFLVVCWTISGAALAAIATHYLSTSSSPAAVPIPTTSEVTVAAAPPPSFAPPPISDLAAIVEAPLFVPSRRREPEAIPAPPPPQGLPRIRLTAVSISGENRIAIIAATDTGAISRVPQGDKIEGWTVAQVLPDRIVLELDGRRSSILLFDK